jgi:hypothetical protein
VFRSRFALTSIVATCLASSCNGRPTPPPARPMQPAPAPAPPASVTPSSAVAATPQLPFYVVDSGLTRTAELRRIDNGIVALMGSDAWLVGPAGLEPQEKPGDSVILPALLEAVVGRWPGPLWASGVRSTGSSGCGELFQRKDGAWSHLRAHLTIGQTYVGIGPWKDGSVLGLRGTLEPPQPHFTFELVAGKAGPLPKLGAPGSVADPEGFCKKWATLVMPRQFLSLASGSVFVLGRTCNGLAAAVETWQPGAERGTVETFADSSRLWPVRLLARSGDDAYALVDALGGVPNPGSVIFHFDGHQWTREAFDGAGHVTNGDLAPDGTLFVIASELDAVNNPKAGRLWRREADGSFRELPLPARSSPEPWAVYSVSAASKDDVWVAASDALLHSVRPAADPRPIELPAVERRYSDAVCSGGRR